MTFDAKENERMDRLAALVAQHRILVGELGLANQRVPELLAEHQKLEERLNEVPPSKLVEFGADVREVAERLHHVEFLLAALNKVALVWATRVSKGDNAMSRELQEVLRLLLQKIDLSFYGEDRARFRFLVQYLPGDTAERAEKVLAVCRELGASLPISAELGKDEQ